MCTEYTLSKQQVEGTQWPISCFLYLFGLQPATYIACSQSRPSTAWGQRSIDHLCIVHKRANINTRAGLYDVCGSKCGSGGSADEERGQNSSYFIFKRCRHPVIFSSKPQQRETGRKADNKHPLPARQKSACRLIMKSAKLRLCGGKRRTVMKK